MTIQQALEQLAKSGWRIRGGATDLAKRETRYFLENQRGDVMIRTAAEIRAGRI